MELENEVRGILRARRGLRPTEKDNFVLNRPEAIANVISGAFDVVGLAGWIIGGFSILVGGFGIANIMFVSVKERTSIIGLQKSLGAKNYFILFQFLFEAIFLSLIGGLAGLFLVYLITFIPMGTLVVTLTIKNIILGLGVSSVLVIKISLQEFVFVIRRIRTLPEIPPTIFTGIVCSIGPLINVNDARAQKVKAVFNVFFQGINHRQYRDDCKNSNGYAQ